MNTSPNPARSDPLATQVQEGVDFFPADPQRASTLSAEQVATFNREGYLCGLPVFSDAEIAAIRTDFDRLLQAFQGQGHDSYRINGYHRCCRSIYDIATTARIHDYVQDLIGPDFVVWGTHYFCKLPGDGKLVPWHQDAHYWPLSPTRTVTVWLAIDDTDAGNGAMQVIPGTHDRGILDHDRYAADDGVLGAQTRAVGELGTPRHLSMRAGQISMHADLLVHGSDPNPGPRRRCGLTIRFAASEVRVNPGSKWTRAAIACRGDHGAWEPLPRPEGDDLSQIPEARGGN